MKADIGKIMTAIDIAGLGLEESSKSIASIALWATRSELRSGLMTYQEVLERSSSASFFFSPIYSFAESPILAIAASRK